MTGDNKTSFRVIISGDVVWVEIEDGLYWPGIKFKEDSKKLSYQILE